MFRFPASRGGSIGLLRRTATALFTPTAATILTAQHRLDSSSTAAAAATPPRSHTRTRVVNENRITQWCRRLWRLANQSSGTGLHAVDSAATATAHAAKTLNLLATTSHAPRPLESLKTSSSSSNSSSTLSSPPVEGHHSEGWAAGRNFATLRPEELLVALRDVVAADAHRLPAVLVETIWEVYNVILPPEVQADPGHALTVEKLTNFFSFVSLLTEADFELDSVKATAKRLQRAIDDYEVAIAESTKAATASSSTPTAKQLERAAALSDTLTQAKGLVVSACFKARNAGSPLYYTWLRHTASMEGGLRRLMDFRKTVHFFDVECKKRIKKIRSEQAKLAAAVDGSATAAKDGTSPATPQETELHFWLKRERDIGVLDSLLTYLFHDFFSKEYLIMEELTWFSTPPSMLEQIMNAEGVHPFTNGLADMRDRLQPTHHRHLFAFLHPAVVEEPLIAVQVALTKGISGSVDYILGRPTPLADPANATAHGRAFQAHLRKYGPDTNDKERVDTAIFYSINSAQSALRGMDMGNMLIKRVVREIDENITASRHTRNLTPIQQFSTLSPIPGYTRWLSGEVEKLNNYAHQPSRSETALVGPDHARVFGVSPSLQELEDRFYKPVREAVLDFAARHDMRDETESLQRLTDALEKRDLVLANAQALTFLVRQFLAPDLSSPWWLDHAFTAQLEQPMLRSAAHYLSQEKKKAKQQILDPVGNFHVSNGATIFRVNFLGNVTAQGSHESGCMMVNYWYNTDTIGDNVARYERDKAVAVDTFITDLLKNESDV